MKRRAALLLSLIALIPVMGLTWSAAQEPRPAPPAATGQAAATDLGGLRALASTVAGHPKPGEVVNVGLTRGVPAGFNGGSGSTTFITGSVIAFDEGWLGLESSAAAGGEPRRIWVPREKVEYVMTTTPKAAGVDVEKR